ncbi:hypothetical protein RhiirA5_416140 [Rhizophagus irregularis]|uniref:L-Lysine epsilon oxidase N-terminal domain-containing protein n=1 Tax=Rhizophagus irregularis TaxID=588596 RepID=A0A2N0PQH6_9GLOM|nr:hypothetical protein RhiirA5_416140 [Rhizophagus irregularis]
MSDIYDELEEIKNRHEIEKYNESREEYQVNPLCLKMENLGVSKRVSIPSYLYRYTRINLADALITNYVNNDCWYDDTSDGPVDAEVTETQE